MDWFLGPCRDINKDDDVGQRSAVSNTVAALRFRFVVRRHRTVTVLVLYRVKARQVVTFLSPSDSSRRLVDVPEVDMQFLGNIRVEQKETASFLTSNSEKPETSPLVVHDSGITRKYNRRTLVDTLQMVRPAENVHDQVLHCAPGR